MFCWSGLYEVINLTRFQKSTLNPTNVSNCRTFSIITFSPKNLEHVIPGQLSTDFQLNYLLYASQTGYKAKNSKYKALCRVTEALHITSSVLILFDLSFAFDIVTFEWILQTPHIHSNWLLDWELCSKVVLSSHIWLITQSACAVQAYFEFQLFPQNW